MLKTGPGSEAYEPALSFPAPKPHLQPSSLSGYGDFAWKRALTLGANLPVLGGGTKPSFMRELANEAWSATDPATQDVMWGKIKSPIAKVAPGGWYVLAGAAALILFVVLKRR